MMKLKTLNDLTISKVKGKKVLLRVDLNCNFTGNKVLESLRIKASVDSIKELKSKKAKVIILAHQGNPGKSSCKSLRSHARMLNRYTKVKFVSEVIGKKSWVAINSLKPGEALLLENVRFLKDEFKPSTKNSMVEFFKEAGVSFYINDAFSVSHRNHTSLVSFPKVFPSFIGRVFENELKNIDKLKSKMKNALFVLGGVKLEDLLPVIKKQKVLSTGKFCLVALRERGFKIGKNNGLSAKDFSVGKKIKKMKSNIQTPQDLAADIKGKRKEILVSDLPVNYKILDIGEEAIRKYSIFINKSNAVFIKGAPGMFEKKGFEKGTLGILKAMEKSKAFCVASGGSIADAIYKFKINKKKFGYVSLSGGSLIAYLAGKKLPGLAALQ